MAFDALLDACEAKKLKDVKAAIGRGASPSKAEEYGQTPFSIACQAGALDVAKYLVDEHGVSVTQGDKSGQSPFWWACFGGSLELCQWLVTQDGVAEQVTKANDKGVTPLETAKAYQHSALAKWLEGHISGAGAGGAEETKGDEAAPAPKKEEDAEDTPEVAAERSGNCGRGFGGVFEKLLDACEGGKIKDVKAAIKAGADPKKHEEFGQTPFSLACQAGALDICKFLVEEHGVSVIQVDTSGQSPFWWAAMAGKLEVCKWLVTLPNVETKAKNTKGVSPLDAAKGWGRKDVVDWLEEYHNTGGTAPAPAAATGGAGGGSSAEAAAVPEPVKEEKEEIVRATDDEEGYGRGFGDKFEKLLEACESGKFKDIKAAASAEGVDPKKHDEYGQTPFSMCCASGCLEACQWLVSEHGVSVTKIDSTLQSPFWWACMAGHLPIVQWLLEQPGVRPTIRLANARDVTPIEAARSWKRADVVAFLEAVFESEKRAAAAASKPVGPPPAVDLGVVWKKGSITRGKRWQKRRVELRDGTLYYYDGKKQKGFSLLKNAKVTPTPPAMSSKPNSIDVSVWDHNGKPVQRTYLFALDSEADVKRWQTEVEKHAVFVTDAST